MANSPAKSHPQPTPLSRSWLHQWRSARELKKTLSDQAGDVRAYSHMELYKIYHALARDNLFLRPWYRRLARKHLEDAVAHAKNWAQPRALLATLELRQGDFWKGREDLSKAIELQRAWIQNATHDKDAIRLDLCNYLILAGSTELHTGQLNTARQAFSSAMEELKTLSPAAQSQRKALEDSIVPAIFDCLFLEHRYAEAITFIDSRTADDPVSSSEDSQRLRVSKDTLSAIIAITGETEPPIGAASLWANLIDDVQRADTADALQKVKAKILTTVKIDDISRGVQTFASAIETILRQQESKVKALEGRLAQQLPAPIPTPSDLSAIIDPQERLTLEKVERATRALIEQANNNAAEVRSTLRSLYSALRRLTQHNIKMVRKLTASTYYVPLKYRVNWIAINAGRFMVQAAAVGYFVDKVVGGFLEQKGRSVAEILVLKKTELIVAVGILAGGFIIGKVAEQKLDKWFAPKYRNLLIRIVVNQFNNLLFKYKLLERLLDEVRKAVAKVKTPDAMPVS
jgi:tetratricopeptide (TPR) repeat protein